MDCALVLKVGGASARPEGFSAFESEIADGGAEIAERMVLVEGDLTAAEITSLLWACDGFVSLHRSEGFGRLLAEAMLMGKPVIATAYSGNVDFMTAENSSPSHTSSCPCRTGPTPVAPVNHGPSPMSTVPSSTCCTCSTIRTTDFRWANGPVATCAWHLAIVPQGCAMPSAYA